jgi:hypothetical protein
VLAINSYFFTFFIVTSARKYKMAGMLFDVHDEDEIVAYASCSIILSTSLLICHAASKPKRRGRVWVRYFLQKREEYGAYSCLMRDLEMHHSDKFRNYVRMEPETFAELLSKVDPLISKKTTRFR